MRELIVQLTEAVNKLGTPTFFDWLPIILSVVTAATAIYIPVRIAKKQNQIAIFDKLYTAYVQLLLVESFATSIKDYDFTGDSTKVLFYRDSFCTYFETNFGYRPNVFTNENNIGTATAALSKNENQAYMIPMLISKNKKEKRDCTKHITNIYEPLFGLTIRVIEFEWDKAEETNKLLKDFTANINTFFDLYADKIEDALLCARKA